VGDRVNWRESNREKDSGAYGRGETLAKPQGRWPAQAPTASGKRRALSRRATPRAKRRLTQRRVSSPMPMSPSWRFGIMTVTSSAASADGALLRTARQTRECANGARVRSTSLGQGGHGRPYAGCTIWFRSMPPRTGIGRPSLNRSATQSLKASRSSLWHPPGLHDAPRPLAAQESRPSRSFILDNLVDSLLYRLVEITSQHSSPSRDDYVCTVWSIVLSSIYR